MSLISLWKSSKADIEAKQVQQLVSIAGEGSLRDGNDTSKELREFLAVIPTGMLQRYVSECLGAPFSDSGLVLQDVINELGARLDFVVEPGFYRGKPGVIGFDGIWGLPNGYSIVVEVKTTDTYSINLDLVAQYRKELISSGRITTESSILLIVGRNDTGGLEAQVRGSRHAWDIRMISVDALMRLVSVKEASDSKSTVEKIRSVLKPNELTKVDFIVELLSTATEDVKEATSEIEEAAPEKKGRGKKFTPVAFNEDVAEKVAKWLKVDLKKKTRSLYVTLDSKIAALCLVSKTHPAQQGKSFYWFAFHPHQKEALSEYETAYVAFGCGAPNKVLVFPRPIFLPWLESMNKTSTTERMYWHVQFVESKKGVIKTYFKSGTDVIDVSEYLV